MKSNGRVALITGAGSGIGEGIAWELAQKGAIVIINDINKEKGEKVAEDIRKAGFIASYRIADITNGTQIKDMVSSIVKEYKKIDILVNNTGIVKDNLILNMPEEDFDFVLEVNLKGAWLVSKNVLNYMKNESYGRIINISSRSWLGQKGQSNYSSSKGGIISLTRALAIEFAKYNITVNAVAPGLIDTPLIKKLRKDVQERLIAAQPTPIIGKPQDVANAVSFLSTKESRYITGQVIHVDGGKSLGANNI